MCLKQLCFFPTFVCVYMNVYVCMWVCLYVWLCMWLCMCVCIYECVCEKESFCFWSLFLQCSYSVGVRTVLWKYLNDCLPSCLNNLQQFCVLILKRHNSSRVSKLHLQSILEHSLSLLFLLVHSDRDRVAELSCQQH